MAATPPPPEQFAADCTAPTYASDMLVCGDPFLRALDARMRDAWAAIDFGGVVAPGAWVETQAVWIRRRSLCAFVEKHAECLQAAYVERLAVLEVLRLVASRPPRQGGRAVCRDAPWGEGLVRVRAPATGALAIEDGDARVLLAATPVRPDSAWTPYVAFAGGGRTIRLQPIDGPAIACRLLDPPWSYSVIKVKALSTLLHAMGEQRWGLPNDSTSTWTIWPKVSGTSIAGRACGATALG